MILVVRIITIMCCTTAVGATCSLIMSTADTKQVDIQQYVITVTGIPSL